METKNEILETILRSIRAELNEFLDEESQITCPVEYETRLIAMSRNFGRTVLEKSQGHVPKSRNLKKK